MLLIQSLLLGLAYMLAPGPVLLETVRRGLRGGMRSAAAVQFGTFVAVLMYAAIFRSGIGQMLAFPGLKFGLGVLGAALLVYLGISMACERKRISHEFGAANPRGISSATAERIWQPFGIGVLLLLFSPYSFAFWFSVGTATLNQSAGSLGAFLSGSAVGCMLVALIAGQLGAPRVRRAANIVWMGCAAVLVALGVQLGYATLLAGGMQ